MTDASDRGWGPGWPAVRTADMVALKMGGVGFPGGVHKDIAQLIKILLRESIDRDWVSLHSGWCWGYSNRPIKTPTGGFTKTPSNHSWGLAIDVNAPVNVFGGTSHQIPEEMGNFWESFGFRWGGHYPSSKDWMHFEFMAKSSDVKRFTKKAQLAKKPKTAAAPHTSPKDDPLTSEWVDGFRMFFRGKAEPKAAGQRKRGWNDARRTVTEPS